jgi:hypothetical protein
MRDLLFINIIHNPVGVCFTMSILEILTYPGYKMILKGAFDYLMKKVRRQKFVNVCTRKTIGKWL